MSDRCVIGLRRSRILSFAIDRRMLSSGTIVNLANDREAIIAALDIVFTGI